MKLDNLYKTVENSFPTKTKVNSAATSINKNASSLKNTDSFSRTKSPNSEVPYDAKNPFVNKIFTLFPKIDSNKNGFISKEELADKLKDKNIKREDAAIVGSMLKYEKQISGLSNDETFRETSGISKKDMIQADKKIEKDNLTGKFDSEYNYRMNKINAVNNLRKPDNSFIVPTKASEINFQDLQQGQNGNCYFLAVLTSIAQTHPEKIVNMIKDNKDGTYDVKFAGKTVKIDSPTDTEIGLYAKGKTWVPIIEKAYAEYRNTFIDFDNPHNAGGSGTLIIGRSILELTGHTFDTDVLKVTSEDTTRKKLTEAVSGKKVIVASIEKEFFGENDLHLPDGHVYTVLNFDAASDMVTIRNPWGHGEALDAKGNALDGKDDGIFKLSVADFKKIYGMVAYEN